MAWERLPDVVLKRIFSYLDAHDRVAWVGLSPRWDQVAASAGCWAYLEVRVGLSENRDRALGLLLAHAHDIRHINLIWNYNPLEDFSMLYLKALLSSKVRLRAVTLTNAVHGHKWPDRNKMLFLLAKLLRKQERLEELNLEGAWIRGNELCHQVKNAGVWVKRLVLTGASRSPGPNLGRLLPRLPGLVMLSLDADVVTPGFLDALTASVPHLSSLTITARLQILMPIANNKWTALSFSHPNLRVNMEIYNR